MRKYETLMVLHPELPDAQTRETIDRARRVIEEMGGKVEQVQEWGMRDLAYPIRKQKRGYYVLTEYASTAEAVTELERNLKIADEILRFLTVIPGPSKRETKPAAAREREISEPSKTQTGVVDKPQTGVEDKPRAGVEDKPQTGVEDKPRAAVEDKPQTAEEDKPQTGVSDAAVDPKPAPAAE